MPNANHDNASITELPQSIHNVSALTATSPTPLQTVHQMKYGSLATDRGRSITELIPESLEGLKESPSGLQNLADISDLDHSNVGQNCSTMVMTRQVVNPVRDGKEPDVIPDWTDYTYHEELDEEDDASIHHDSDTILVSGDQNEPPSYSASRVAHHPTSQTNRGLPARLDNLLEEWYARHGRIVPKCVCKRSESSMADLWHSKTSRAPVTWLHRSGVPLNVTWYPLPDREVKNQGNSAKLIVVDGPGVAPSIVSYKNAGGHIAGIKEHGVVYRIWRGLDGDKDGFEFSPSVIKMSRSTGKPKTPGMSTGHEIQAPSPSTNSTKPESTFRCEHCTMRHLGCDRKQPTCSRCASTGRICQYQRTLVLSPESNGLKAESTFDGLGLQRSERARRPTTRYNSEELAPTRKRKVNETSFDLDDDEDSNALLSKFMASSPLTSASSLSFLRASKTKPWVCYLCGDASTNKKYMRSHFRQIHGLNPDETRMKWTHSRDGTQKAQTFVIAPNGKEATATKRTARMEAVPDKGKALGAEQVEETAPREDNEHELDEHIRNNTKVIFFSRTHTPRVRLFATCDTSHKLFAQATAGGVFSREYARVLAIELDDHKSELPIVEDDDEDFNHFFEQLRNSSCWGVKNGQLQGDTIVHVREKRI